MHRSKSPNLKDVAAAAGVSVATVSRLLNGSLALPDETRSRIEEAIRRLNYQPNPHARRLSRGRSDTVGLVIPDIANPFFATLVAAVEEEAVKRGLDVALHATLNQIGREISYLQLIERNHIDGLIFVTNHPDDEHLTALINRTSRVVIVDEDVPGALAPRLFCDNEQGGYLAGRHLAEHGHRNVLFLGGPQEMVSTVGRLTGLSKAMAERFGAAAHIVARCGAYTVGFGQESAMRFIAEGMPETAIFASSDEIAIGLIEIFHRENIDIPGAVSVVGFDDVAPLHLFAPPVTAIRQPVRAMGRRALALLAETDWEDRAALDCQERLPVELVERRSVARLDR